MLDKNVSRREFLSLCLKAILITPFLGLLARLGANPYLDNRGKRLSSKEASHYKNLAG